MPLFSSIQIGLAIRNARKKKSAEIGFGFTRKMLADAIEESVQIISLLEAGKYYPDFEHIQKISKICGVTIEDLVGKNFNSMDDYLAAIQEATKNQSPNANKDSCISTDPY